MEEFIYEYYLRPLWDRTGYNLINTITYAVIAIIALYFIRKWLNGKIEIKEKFIAGVLSFVLIGSGYRVITDAIDNRVFSGMTPLHQTIIDSHVFDYGYLTVTPGIYVVTATLLLFSIFVLYRMKKMEWLTYVGLILAVPAYLLLLPFMVYAIYAIPIIILALIPAYIAHRHFEKNNIYTAVVAGQALDGAATFFIIDIFSQISGKQYFEQHVVSAGIGSIFGSYFAFYLLKIIIAFAAVYFIREEKISQEDKNYLALALMIMGFAPGIRDILRMMIGG